MTLNNETPNMIPPAAPNRPSFRSPDTLGDIIKMTELIERIPRRMHTIPVNKDMKLRRRFVNLFLLERTLCKPNI